MKRLQIFWLGRLEYKAAEALQEALVAQRRTGEIPDTLLLLEHEPVITIGRSGGEIAAGAWAAPQHNELSPSSRKGKTPSFPIAEGNRTPIPIVETSRGGRATYHGPGQLVAYPIVDLRELRKDLHWYLRCLEEVAIEALRAYGVTARNREGFTGVWIGEKKIASIGIAVRGWITYHGLALNVNCDLEAFRFIRPCGLPPEIMTSLQEQGIALTVEEAAEAFARAFRRVFGHEDTPEKRFFAGDKSLLYLEGVSTTIYGSSDV